MRTFSDTVKAILATNNISTFYLVETKIPLASVTYPVLPVNLPVPNSIDEGSFRVVKETTAAFNLTVSPLGTFYCDSGLMIVEGPRQSSSVDRETYVITYADPTFEKRALFEAGITGAKVTVYVGFFNNTDTTLSGFAPGLPILNSADILVAYSGVVDTHGYTIDPASGTITVVIECSSPMASLGLVRSFYTSRESMKQISATDTAFNQVSVTQSKTAYLWGKKE
jgi:hypothetical protein